MADSNSMMVDFVTLGLDSLELGHDEAMVSSEDVAWADSCLTRDSDVLDSGWNSMKDALLETFTSQQDTSAHEREDFSEGPKMEFFPSFGVKSGMSAAVCSNGACNYSLRDVGVSDLVQAFQFQSTEDIFKIWDTCIPSEEDDFVGAFAESSLETTPSVSHHIVAPKGLNDESFDDLISGVADLSLRLNFD